jgi:hypothetical protein
LPKGVTLANPNLSGIRTDGRSDYLIARGDVVGIVNNVGVARHESVDAVDPETRFANFPQNPFARKLITGHL